MTVATNSALCSHSSHFSKIRLWHIFLHRTMWCWYSPCKFLSIFTTSKYSPLHIFYMCIGGVMPLDMCIGGIIPLDLCIGGVMPLDQCVGGVMPLDQWIGGVIPLNQCIGGVMPLDLCIGWLLPLNLILKSKKLSVLLIPHIPAYHQHIPAATTSNTTAVIVLSVFLLE